MYIRQNKYPNARILAQEFEISERQAQRDIEYLRSSLGAPLFYDPQKRGYLYDNQTYVLPQVYLTEDQRKILRYLAYRYENYQNNQRVNQLAQLFQRISRENQKEEEKLPIFQPDDEMVDKINLLLQARNSCQKLTMEYHQEKFVVHIYYVFQKNDIDYAVGFCQENQEIMVFRVDEMQEFQIHNETFQVRKEFRKGDYESIPTRIPFQATICFSEPFLEPVSIQESGVVLKDCTCKIQEGCYEFQFWDADQFVDPLLLEPHWVKIQSPKWFKEKLRKRCLQILDKINCRSDIICQTYYRIMIL